ncbi:protein kinase domain-containing protein [Dermatophilus congolensis]|uniref:protein kinase domain-containing protein n=1 Tax=Dermatophilus congolensis TaxID=1863 RepID=UPI001AAFFDCD|nr:protein kinase [Dermatophilus congolensis]MBO3143863.1 protein kinase [Dermatophilus congolensis]MBO3152854.1 protein kinase [Dermatophilus congolensis]MBO3160136.1 protein kinase [Dermatophilus congolensis]MBO3164139.1 protein kinase [Dermatophilus congolensis]MBO3177685.1 protein kinase [Dermatophilus congolensis]
MRYETGLEFGNRYTLGDRIAVGGMGEVWRARDKVLERDVAIKLLSPTLAGQPGFAQRFREEARNSAALGHPNIANVYDYGEDSGAHWLVMELVEGNNLAHILKDEVRIDPDRTSSILAQAALGLQAAHDAGVIHRDVKTANIIIRNDGVAKITDFGISRAIDAVPITRTGEVMGTAQYISPEQATGKPVGPASDIYSLGVVAYEMVAGHRPFEETSPVATAMAHVQDPVPPLPGWVPEDLSTVIMSCLNKAPEDRPASAGDLARMLTGGPSAAGLLATQRITQPGSGQRITTRPQTHPVPTYYEDDIEESPRNKTWLWFLIAIAVIGLLIFGGMASGLLGGGSKTPDSPETISPTSTAPTTSSPSSTTADSSGESSTIDARDYIGLTADEASAKLRERGFVPKINHIDAPQSAETVVSIDPTGSVSKGSEVKLNVSRGKGSGSSKPGSTATVTVTQAPSHTRTQNPAPSDKQPPSDQEPDSSDKSPDNSGKQNPAPPGGGANGFPHMHSAQQDQSAQQDATPLDEGMAQDK